MKRHTKQFISSVCTLVLLGNIHIASADLANDTETLLNWAENTYPQFLPSRRATQSLDPWLYRFYPEANIYAGVNKNDNGIYVLGGPWGDNPVFIDTLPNLISHIESSGGNGSISACNTSNVPDGLSYSQSGNVVSVTTNGQCIEIPSNINYCQTPMQATASGISILSTIDVTAAEWSGITSDLPINRFESLTGTTKHCTINAPAEQTNLVVNTDICLDMTQQLESSLAELIASGYVTVDPPVTLATKSTFSSQEVVLDCFATDAASIHDAFTNGVWIKQGEDFVEIN